MSKRKKRRDDTGVWIKRPRVVSSTNKSTSVKAKLQTVCKNALLRAEIYRVSAGIRQCQLEAARLALAYVLYCHETQEPMRELNDQTFWRSCIGGVLGRSFDQSVFGCVVEIYCSRRAKSEDNRPIDLHAASICVTQLAAEMRKEAIKHAQSNFAHRLRDYVQLRFGIGRGESEAIVARVSSSSSSRDCQRTSEVRRFVGREFDDADIQVHLNHYMLLMVEMCSFAEMTREAAKRRSKPVPRAARPFRVLPIPSLYIPRHIAITTTVLHQMCSHISSTAKVWLPGPNVPHDPAGFQDVKEQAWRELFAVETLETQQRRFGCFVSSDGVACSVLLLRRNTKNDVDHERRHGRARYDFDAPVDLGKLVAIDPGVRCIATAVSLRADQVAQANLERSAQDKQRGAVKHVQERDRRRLIQAKRTKQRRAGKRARERRRQKQRRQALQQPLLNVIQHDKKQQNKKQHLARKRKYKTNGRRSHRGSARRKRTHNMSPSGEHLKSGYAVQRVSLREYRHLARFSHHAHWLESLKVREPEWAEMERTMPTFKTAGLQTVLASLAIFFARVNYLLAFGREHAFRQWRFKRHRFQQKALAALAKRIVPEQGMVVALGDWSRQDIVRGHPRAPVKLLEEAIALRAKVVRVDEFATSSVCSWCLSDVEGAWSTRNVQRCHGCGLYWDRDVNGARNIHTLAALKMSNKERPEQMERGWRRRRAAQRASGE